MREPIDRAQLLETAGDPDVAARLLRTYAESLAAELPHLEAEEGNDAALARIAHRMHGAALFIGAGAVARAAQALREAPNPQALAPALAELRRAAAEAAAWARRESGRGEP
jgi:HPt (histidine-containing phosphotransfer) domain-containing protein